MEMVKQGEPSPAKEDKEMVVSTGSLYVGDLSLEDKEEMIMLRGLKIGSWILEILHDEEGDEIKGVCLFSKGSSPTKGVWKKDEEISLSGSVCFIDPICVEDGTFSSQKQKLGKDLYVDHWMAVVEPVFFLEEAKRHLFVRREGKEITGVRVMF